MMCKEGADTRTSGRLYVEVVQSVMIFGLESWIFTSALCGRWGDSIVGQREGFWAGCPGVGTASGSTPLLGRT